MRKTPQKTRGKGPERVGTDHTLPAGFEEVLTLISRSNLEERVRSANHDQETS
jgi:hypothetical protein